jgi:hypothetical protein
VQLLGGVWLGGSECGEYWDRTVRCRGIEWLTNPAVPI